MHPLVLNSYYVPGTVPFTEAIFEHTLEMALAFLQFPGGIFCELASILALADLVFHFLDISYSCFFLFQYCMFLCNIP